MFVKYITEKESIKKNKITEKKVINYRNIQVARNLRGISISELSKKSGVSRKTISLIETGKCATIKGETLEKINLVLNFPIEFYFQKSLIINDFELKKE